MGEAVEAGTAGSTAHGPPPTPPQHATSACHHAPASCPTRYRATSRPSASCGPPLKVTTRRSTWPSSRKRRAWGRGGGWGREAQRALPSSRLVRCRLCCSAPPTTHPAHLPHLHFQIVLRDLAADAHLQPAVGCSKSGGLLEPYRVAGLRPPHQRQPPSWDGTTRGPKPQTNLLGLGGALVRQALLGGGLVPLLGIVEHLAGRVGRGRGRSWSQVPLRPAQAATCAAGRTCLHGTPSPCTHVLLHWAMQPPPLCLYAHNPLHHSYLRALPTHLAPLGDARHRRVGARRHHHQVQLHLPRQPAAAAGGRHAPVGCFEGRWGALAAACSSPAALGSLACSPQSLLEPHHFRGALVALWEQHPHLRAQRAEQGIGKASAGQREGLWAVASGSGGTAAKADPSHRIGLDVLVAVRQRALRLLPAPPLLEANKAQGHAALLLLLPRRLMRCRRCQAGLLQAEQQPPRGRCCALLMQPWRRRFCTCRCNAV